MTTLDKDLAKLLHDLADDLGFAAQTLRDRELAESGIADEFSAYLDQRVKQIAGVLGEPVTDLDGEEQLLVRYYRTLTPTGQETALDAVGAMAGWHAGAHAARRDIEGEVLAFWRGLPETVQDCLFELLGARAEA